MKFEIQPTASKSKCLLPESALYKYEAEEKIAKAAIQFNFSDPSSIAISCHNYKTASAVVDFIALKRRKPDSQRHSTG
jgi:hypothetical protein